MPPPIPRPTRKPSQAALVTAWLGTYELLVSDTIRVIDIGGRREVVQVPGPDALAHAATTLVSMMDLEGSIFTGVGNNLSPLEPGIRFSPEDSGA
jgi:hypothetical protein